MKMLLLSLFVLSSGSAMASDSWDSCSNADGSITMENGRLYVNEIGETVSFSVRVLHTLKTEVEKCILKGYESEVIAYDNTVTVEEVQYTLEEDDLGDTVFVICERGGSGIPANSSCK